MTPYNLVVRYHPLWVKCCLSLHGRKMICICVVSKWFSLLILEEESARRGDLYLTTHKNHKRNVHDLGRIRTRNPSKRTALDRAATAIGDCCDRGFEFRWWHGCSSLVFVVCCAGSGFCDQLITRPGEFYRLCACIIACDLQTWTLRRLSPELGFVAPQKTTFSQELSLEIMFTLLKKISDF